jgi:hypothetical protein
MENTVYGYLYDDNDMHGDPYLFEGTPRNIASFVTSNQDCPKIVITDMMDQLLVETSGGFLMQTRDNEYCQSILKELVPMQMDGAEPGIIDYLEMGTDPNAAMTVDDTNSLEL